MEAKLGADGADLRACGNAASRRFGFAPESAPDEKPLRHAAIHHPRLSSGMATTPVAGTVVTTTDQGCVVLDGRFPAERWWGILITYSVSHVVSTWADVGTWLMRTAPDAGDK